MSAGGRRRVTLVLAALTVLVLALSVPGSLREAWERGGAALLVGPVLIAAPYAVARALANRVTVAREGRRAR